MVSVAGTFNGEAVEPGDMIIAKTDNPGSVLSNYTIVNKNIPTIVNASETASGIVSLQPILSSSGSILQLLYSFP